MKKKSNKQTSGKKPRNSKRASASASTSKQRVLMKQPQLKQQAAVAHGMFLYTDDAWSMRYFDNNDLHYKEREIFG